MGTRKSNTRRRKRKKSASEKKSLYRYWGYTLLVALYLGWFSYGLDPVVMGVISSLAVFYGLFQAPVPCSARNRDNNKNKFCRNDAFGLLRGCHFEQHKWQNAIMLFRRQSWVQFAHVTFRSIKGNAAALTVLVGLVSAAAAVAQVVLR